MDKLVSVIVPVYKVENYLDKCVESIVNQTYKKLEIILVDDGSPDNCPEMCDCWALKDNRIKVIHKSNGGPSSARNIGIEYAIGDYLGFVDSDDWISLDLFEKVMTIFDEHNPDIVTFDCNRVNEKRRNYTSTENIKHCLLSSEQALEELLKGNINNYACNKVFKKHVFEGIEFPEGRYFEDMAVCYKLFLNSKNIYSFPAKLYFYFTRSSSISKTITGKALCDIFLARYECHMTLKVRYPTVLKFSLPLVALAARRLYDRSLWEEVDMDALETAKKFLQENKKTILQDIKDIKYQLYYNTPGLYSIIRGLKHKFGMMVKGLSK